ncbi:MULTISPECIES: hypothetical protein [Burkholderia]|uniref:hypothetical protein n=1 Tax=Burkholderia TaxID=32008 RepID=UPI001E56BC2F|nr:MULTISPECIES: hypothetical protein [unclassified Burkholderia]UEP31206.1 hypothetical protein LMA01_18465 [Burkholderia sp. B21-007]UEP43517.1 hypothetical protein LMA02_26035 [Burkholderia sp. B21-005]
MTQCKTFYGAFKQNMDALGLPAPTSLFAAQQTAIGTLTTILGTLRTLGPTATIGELIGATTGLELLAAASALGASFYVGAVIGSLIVAADASLVCDQRGVVAVDGIRSWATRRGLAVPQDVYRVIALHPEVFRPTPGSATFAIRARSIGRAIA